MTTSVVRVPRLALPFLMLLAAVLPLHAELPPLSDADRNATAPASDPRAPTIVLYKKATLQFRDLKKQQVSSNLHLEQRVKVLTQEGLHGGEIELAHGRDFRLQSLHGRTILPDGKEIALGSDARFERRLSSKSHTWVTAVAFPGVQVGAILELEADFYFDSFLFLEPWYMSDSVPVKYSEVEYQVPKNIVAQTWGRDPFQVGVQTDKTMSVQGVRMRAWAKDLPAVPSEPFGPPFADVATQYGLLVTAWANEDVLQRYFESWESTCKLIDDNDYSPARHGDAGVAAKAKALAGSLADPRAKAEAVYRFVRDQVRTDKRYGVVTPVGSTLAKVLADGSGDLAEKALLLQDMLDAVKVKSKLVWANDRSTGTPIMDVPNPIWFERVLVAAELPKGTVYLDPSEQALPFGVLTADVEGGQALLFDRKKPQVITLPMLSPDANRRVATVKLAVDEKGSASGNGELRLTGQHAVEALGESEASKLAETWTKWLESRFPGFAISGVQAAPASDGSELRVEWAMAQRAADVLGDELTLLPSRPLGPVAQPLALSPNQRRTPVMLPFADQDEVSLDVSFPAGWKVESMPESLAVKTTGGALTIESKLEADQHTLHYDRRLEVASREGTDRDAYTQLYGLFDQAVKQDAKALALVRR